MLIISIFKKIYLAIINKTIILPYIMDNNDKMLNNSDNKDLEEPIVKIKRRRMCKTGERKDTVMRRKPRQNKSGMHKNCAKSKPLKVSTSDIQLMHSIEQDIKDKPLDQKTLNEKHIITLYLQGYDVPEISRRVNMSLRTCHYTINKYDKIKSLIDRHILRDTLVQCFVKVIDAHNTIQRDQMTEYIATQRRRDALRAARERYIKAMMTSGEQVSINRGDSDDLAHPVTQAHSSIDPLLVSTDYDELIESCNKALLTLSKELTSTNKAFADYIDRMGVPSLDKAGDNTVPTHSPGDTKIPSLDVSASSSDVKLLGDESIQRQIEYLKGLDEKEKVKDVKDV